MATSRHGLDGDDEDHQWPHHLSCDFCHETGHGIFDCPEREEWHREQRDLDAALRLDPVCRDPD